MSTLPAMHVGPIGIRQDRHGLFNLNDLHAASGGENRHQPNRFLRTDQTAALIAELRAESNTQKRAIDPVQSQRGRTGGTFVARELVYAYAMWISPTFYLSVIRVFDDVQRVRKQLGDKRHELDVQRAVGRKLAARGASDMGRWSWESRRLNAQYASLNHALQLSLFND